MVDASGCGPEELRSTRRVSTIIMTIFVAFLDAGLIKGIFGVQI